MDNDKRMSKIISGGQTGVDRGALDAALASWFPCGGWCPEARKAEDGIIPKKYSLIELAGAGYSQRTLKNVLESDATVIIYFTDVTGGTKETLSFCIENKKPYLLIDGNEISINKASEHIAEFVQSHEIAILNVAGPRASSAPKAHEFTKACLIKFLARIIE